MCAAAVSGCERPTAEQCERMCWRINELHFWERFEREDKNKDPAAREQLRAERQKLWAEMKARKFDPGLENCLKDCRRGAYPSDVECVEKARTAAQATDCVD
jgi:hypothetical protein